MLAFAQAIKRCEVTPLEQDTSRLQLALSRVRCLAIKTGAGGKICCDLNGKNGTEIDLPSLISGFHITTEMRIHNDNNFTTGIFMPHNTRCYIKCSEPLYENNIYCLMKHSDELRT